MSGQLRGTGTCMWSQSYKAGMIKRLQGAPPMSIHELAEKKGISVRTAQNMIYEIASTHPVYSIKCDDGKTRYEVQQ